MPLVSSLKADTTIMKTLRVGSIVICGWTAYTVIAEMREGFIMRANNKTGRLRFIFELGLPLNPHVEYFMLGIYRRRGYEKVHRWLKVS